MVSHRRLTARSAVLAIAASVGIDAAEQGHQLLR